MARGGFTVAERLAQFGPQVEERLKPAFEAAGVKYPPERLAFVAFKDAKVLELYGKDAEQPWRFIKAYPVLAASGKPGPKLREGDLQVPEGLYGVESLNPNSRFHLSVRVSYPNEFDRRMANAEGRTNLGGDIMIHGSSVSVGCLAMGDDAAEELFVLSGLVGRERISIRKGAAMTPPFEAPSWAPALYQTLRDELQHYPPLGHRS
jgi:hypothetical protein